MAAGAGFEHMTLSSKGFDSTNASQRPTITKLVWMLCPLMILSSYGVLSQLYADDTQAYLHCHSTSAMGAARTMHQAMGAPADWMSSNRLRLNAQKTKFIWLGNRQQLAKLNLDALSAEFPTMSFSQVVRDLGVLLDSELTFSHHIDQVCRSCYYQLRQLRVIAHS